MTYMSPPQDLGNITEDRVERWKWKEMYHEIESFGYCMVTVVMNIAHL